MEKRRYFPQVDLLRGVAIVSVLLYHSIIEYPIDLRAQAVWCDWLFRFLAAYHMPLFFLLSGFVYSCKNYGEYLKKRALRLLVPYLVFGGGSVVLHAAAGSLVNGEAGLLDGFKSLALYGGEYWFLYTLFLISAAFPLLEKIRWRFFLPLLIGITVLMEPFPMPRIFLLNKNFYYLGYFALGVLARRQIGALESLYGCIRRRPAFWSAGTLGAFVLVFGLLLAFAPAFALRSYVFALFGCVAVIVCCVAFDFPASLRSFLSLCGRYSLQLYLLNGYLLVIGRTALVSFAHVTSPALLVLSLFLFCLLGELFISKYILDTCRLFRVLSGIAPTK